MSKYSLVKMEGVLRKITNETVKIAAVILLLISPHSRFGEKHFYCYSQYVFQQVGTGTAIQKYSIVKRKHV